MGIENIHPISGDSVCYHARRQWDDLAEKITCLDCEQLLSPYAMARHYREQLHMIRLDNLHACRECVCSGAVTAPLDLR